MSKQVIHEVKMMQPGFQEIVDGRRHCLMAVTRNPAEGHFIRFQEYLTKEEKTKRQIFVLITHTGKLYEDPQKKKRYKEIWFKFAATENLTT